MALIKKLTSEPTIYVFTGIFILLMILTSSDQFSTKLASVYGFMILIDLGISQLITSKFNINPLGGNTINSILWAAGAILLLSFVYKGINVVARASIEGSAFSQNFTSIKSQASLFSIEFEKIPFLSFMLFGIVIPIIETRLLARIFDFFTQTFQIGYNKFSGALLGVIVFCASLFTYFHFKVRGLNNNVDLFLTFIFGLMTLYLFIKFKEAESATEFHIGWNSLAILKG